MFCVIYSFQVKKGLTDQFQKGWTGLTELIYQFEGSLGSRLHQESDLYFIAYAQWPSKEIWSNSGQKLPEEANGFRKLMRDSCVEIKTLHELEMVDDLLKSEPFS